MRQRTNDAAAPPKIFLLRVILCGSYMSERMVIRAKELQVEKAAMEEAMAKDEALRCSGMFHAAVF